MLCPTENGHVPATAGPSTTPFLTKCNLRRHPDWQGIDFDPSGLPIVFKNHYRCECGEEWDMEWSCECGDRCPWCDTETDAHTSDWIGPEGGYQLWDSLPDMPPLGDEGGISCGCGWTGDEGALIGGKDAADGQYSDCLCPSCKSDSQLRGFDVLGGAA